MDIRIANQHPPVEGTPSVKPAHPPKDSQKAETSPKPAPPADTAAKVAKVGAAAAAVALVGPVPVAAAVLAMKAAAEAHHAAAKTANGISHAADSIYHAVKQAAKALHDEGVPHPEIPERLRKAAKEALEGVKPRPLPDVFKDAIHRIHQEMNRPDSKIGDFPLPDPSKLWV